MQFHAFEVKKEFRLQLPENHCFHLSVISASSDLKEKGGQVTLYATVDGKTFALGTISTTEYPSGVSGLQIATDLIFTAVQEVSFHVQGGKSVNCIGYVQSLGEDDEEESIVEDVPSDDVDSLEEGEESEEDGEDDFQLPIDSAMKNATVKAGKHPRIDEVTKEAKEKGSPNAKKKLIVDPTQLDLSSD